MARNQQDHIVNTTLAYPTLYLHLPQGNDEGLFQLYEIEADSDNKNNVYKTLVSMTCEQSGISGFTLPQDAPALQVGKYYLGLLNFSQVGLAIEMHLQKVELESLPPADANPLDQAIDYAENHVWVEPVNILAKQVASGDEKAKAEWSGLLSDNGLEEIADRAIVNCITAAE
jgi:hypothetical protein